MSFNFNEMLRGMSSYVQNVQKLLGKLESETGGMVNLSTMFQLQFRMQILSQYVEAVSGSLSAAHNSMMTMARATKGQ